MKTLEVRNGYLHVYYDETNDANALIALMQDIADTCKREKIRKVLGDLSNMNGEDSILGRFRAGVAAVRIFRGMPIKIAIVYKKVESNRFAETVAVNRGLPSFITHDMKLAKRWLEVE